MILLARTREKPLKKAQDYIDICFFNINLTRCAAKNGIEALICDYLDP